MRHLEVSWREEHFGVLLYDRRTDTLYQGNHVAGEVLGLLEEGASGDEIVAKLCARYQANGKAVRCDVEQFLRFLLEQDLAVRW